MLSAVTEGSKDWICLLIVVHLFRKLKFKLNIVGNTKFYYDILVLPKLMINSNSNSDNNQDIILCAEIILEKK